MNFNATDFLLNSFMNKTVISNNSTIAEEGNIFQIPVNILLCFIFLVGLLGNISVCVVIVRRKSMHTTTNYYLFSLAISDLLIIICSLLPWTLKILLERDVFKGLVCVIRKVASKTGYFATLLTVLAFSIERYIAVCHPFVLYKIDNLSRIVKIIIAFWIVAFCLALPKAFYTPCYGNVDLFSQTIDLYKIHLELFTFVSYIVTIMIIIVLYVLIGLKLRESNKLSSTNSVDQKKVIKMLVAVVIALLICWTPTRIYRFYIFYLTVDKEKLELENSSVNYYVRKITRALYYVISTIINPLLYNIMSNKFREGFIETFLCKKKRADITPMNVTVTEDICQVECNNNAGK